MISFMKLTLKYCLSFILKAELVLVIVTHFEDNVMVLGSVNHPVAFEIWEHKPVLPQTPAGLCRTASTGVKVSPHP